MAAALALSACGSAKDDSPKPHPTPSASTALPGSTLITAKWQPATDDLSGALILNTGEAILQPLMVAFARQKAGSDSYTSIHKATATSRIKRSQLRFAYAVPLRTWTNPAAPGVNVYTTATNPSDPISDGKIVLMKVKMGGANDNLAGYAYPEGDDLVSHLVELADMIRNLPQQYHKLCAPVETTPAPGTNVVANGYVGYVGLQ